MKDYLIYSTQLHLYSYIIRPSLFRAAYRYKSDKNVVRILPVKRKTLLCKIFEGIKEAAYLANDTTFKSKKSRLMKTKKKKAKNGFQKNLLMR